PCASLCAYTSHSCFTQHPPAHTHCPSHIRHTYCAHSLFNPATTTETYTLSLHDALPICRKRHPELCALVRNPRHRPVLIEWFATDRKSTRLNSSHEWSSYAVFCLGKKKRGLAHDEKAGTEGMGRMH